MRIVLNIDYIFKYNFLVSYSFLMSKNGVGGIPPFIKITHHIHAHYITIRIVLKQEEKGAIKQFEA